MTAPTAFKRRVFQFPVKIVVECELYVLANDHDDAAKELEKIDLQDLIASDDTMLTVDGQRLAIIDTLTTDPSDILDADDAKELSSSEYPANEHPDFSGVPDR